MEDDMYKSLEETRDRLIVKKRTDLKKLYSDFLHDFRDYLVEYVRESMVELTVSEMTVSVKPIKLSVDDKAGMYLTVKNQGKIECFISTENVGGFRLDPGEKEKLWLNNEVTAVTLSGNTSLGFIRT